MSISPEPQLAPPGAGLPSPELFLGRIFFAWRRATSSRDSATARFQSERQVIRTLVQSCEPADASTRVLIARPRGLEDSSRYWSIWMTLDHLRIVHGEIARIIESLARGVSPSGKASTAAVKPSPDVDASVVAEYEKSCDTLLATIAASGNLKTSARFPHPWFGPLDGAGWHTLSAGHMGIHRVQIERIRAGLKTPARFAETSSRR